MYTIKYNQRKRKLYTKVYKAVTIVLDNLYNIEYDDNGGANMYVSYKKLFKLMEEKGIKKYDLRKSGISPTIVNRLVKNGDVNTSTIIKLCELLLCQPGDIMECVDEEGFNRLIPTKEGLRRMQDSKKQP